MNLLIFILCAFGITQILCYGKIFDSLRPKYGKLGELFSCSMCLGFWVGFILWFLKPYTDLYKFDDSLFSGFLLACLSSGTSYLLDKLMSDEGLQIKINSKNYNEYRYDKWI